MPRTQGSLWERIIAWDNLYSGYCEARNGKRYRQDVLEFGNRLEERLIEIQNRLIWKAWAPARWNEFYVYDPKKRLIEAPQFKDRVVHHALVRIIEPLFERKFIHDSYACRKGKGTHAAVDKLQGFLRQARRQWGKVYVLKADIAAYFPSIVHDRLLAILSRTIRDKNAFWLCRTIVEGCGHQGRGVPVGALTSQLFANIYLDQLDHLIKDEFGEPFYLRFMDDWVILAPSKARLNEILAEVKECLIAFLGLSLNPKTRIFPAHQGVDFAGYRIWVTHRLPRKRNVLRARKRFRLLMESYGRGEITLDDIRPSVASFLGYMKHCSSFRTVQGILNDFVLKRNIGEVI
ncbi:MAG TPA: alpha/beta hydrolase [Desulfobacterales bacterium]|nr:alpha/beta hydrolase [Desulfobacterales bacterium]